MSEIVTWVLMIAAYPFIAAWLVGLRRSYRINDLEEHVAVLREKVQQMCTSPSGMAAPDSTSVTAPILPQDAVEEARPGDPPESPTPPVNEQLAARTIDGQTAEQTFKARPGRTPPTFSATPVELDAALPPPEHDTPPSPPSEPQRWLIAAKTWLMTGNLVAKLGLIILFIGIAFLLKQVAAIVTIPMELRLAAVVFADLGLLSWGWRLRSKRREIGLPVQGTAIAILMLVMFSASQRYDLIPTGAAFALLVSLMVFTCLLAILQEAPWLAAFGITGGFACPLLLSTGQGSHIALFSYYALLNAGVFVLAFKRSWHQLNLLGFVFTFGVAGAWGALQYIPQHYTSAQAFLILFFLCYSTIPLAFAGRTRTRLQDYVNATLVIGTPLLTFGYQVALVKGMELGLAFSALAMGAFYLVGGTILWRAGKERWRSLVQTFVVMGAIFGTLTIPFALDARWTSAAWALQGFGFVWFGLQHQRRAIWICGLLLQVGAWVSFMTALSRIDRDAALSAHLWLGFLLLAGSAYAIAMALRKPGGDEQDLSPLADTALGLAAALLLAGCWTEAALRLSGGVLADCMVASAMLTAILLYVASLRMVWPMTRQLILAVQIVGTIGLLVVSARDLSWTRPIEADSDAPLLGVLILAIAACVTSRTLWRARPAEDAGLLASTMLLASAIWWMCALNVGYLAPYPKATQGASPPAPA